ncbi:MAG TPA: hypothetical protein VJT71_18920 [Pyrinomonadaceae bacterium]|nr:hypothetical protein [Pyrinomonadaceae bacterium]
MATKKKTSKKTVSQKSGKKKAGSKKKTAGKAKASGKKKSAKTASPPGLLKRAKDLVSDIFSGPTQTATGAIESVAQTGTEAIGLRRKKK